MNTLYFVDQTEKSIPINVNFWTFPGGERGCKIEPYKIPYGNEPRFRIDMKFKSSDDLIDLLLLNNALRNMYAEYDSIFLVLRILYFPYARQDRVMSVGESLSLQVAVDVVKQCNPNKVIVADPHSDVLFGMFNPGQLLIIPQHDLISIYTPTDPNTYLVSPDAGALKKIYKLASKYELPVIEAGKVRDVSTGNIVATRVQDIGVRDPVVLVVFDDIIDGGKTFIELAKELKSVYNVKRLVLCATHGIFSKGLDVLADYDQIYVYNNMSNYDLKGFNSRKSK